MSNASEENNSWREIGDHNRLRWFLGVFDCRLNVDFDHDTGKALYWIQSKRTSSRITAKHELKRLEEFARKVHETASDTWRFPVTPAANPSKGEEE